MPTDGAGIERDQQRHRAPDLDWTGPVVLSVTTASVGFAGSTITATDVVTNLGGHGESVNDAYYLSVNGGVNSPAARRQQDDRITGGRSVEHRSVVLTIPGTRPSAPPRRPTDADGTVGESVESNNTRER